MKANTSSLAPRTIPVLEPRGIVPALHLATWLKGDVRYISDQNFHLVLYVDANQVGDTYPSEPFQSPPRFKNPSQWKLLFHQTAGYACHHRYLYTKFLNPLPIIEKLGKRLLSKYNASLITKPPSLSTAMEYNAILETHGVSANRSYTGLEEGFYPVDIKCLPKVTKEKFSRDLSKELIKTLPEYKKRSAMDVFSNWVDFELAILGPNCD